MRPILRVAALFVAGIMAVNAIAADPTATSYKFVECQGSYMPYPEADVTACPDSLEPVMINHVGRHGARFPSSSRSIKAVQDAISRAQKAGTLTKTGQRLAELCDAITVATAGRWGALDSLGEAEQAGIATRMYRAWPSLFENGRVKAESSYSPRAIMSMYTFVHQLSRMDNRLEIITSSGRSNSTLLRPFDIDEYYKEYRAGDAWKAPLEELTNTAVTPAPLQRVLGEAFDLGSKEEMAALAMDEYAVVACAASAGIKVDASVFFTESEYNSLWSVANLRHYLQYSSSTLSTAAAEMASPLLRDLIDTTDANAVEAPGASPVILRFGHAETLMPLLALMHLPGCYYMTNYFDTVGLHWRDFYIVPMAANLQLILLKHKDNGRLYLRVDLNEKPVSLIPGRTAVYTPWETAKEYLTRCLPLMYQ